ncbi:glycosyltransferase family 4 protein [Flavobacterium sp.]|uniref:glycosyltransferase family 4 protein n=1 Tax=Flavobacterium sp. TaxID=239 RepID=UPI0038D200B7
MKNRRIIYIGNNLSGKGYSATVMETLGNLLTTEGYEIIQSSSKKNSFIRLLDMIFTTIYYSKKADYVLIDTYSTLNFWYAFLISQTCRILNLKYIPILHGGNLPSRLNANPRLCDLIFKNAYKNVAPSKYLFSFLSSKYSHNLITIPNALEIENYKFTARNFENPKLLWVRSFSQIANPKMALKVFFELKKEYPNAELTMVGPDNSNHMKECETFAKEIKLKVNFTGLLEKEEWILLSKSHNFFINTSNFDNMPVSVIEAMALGLPVISTNVGGIPFLFEDQKNTLLVEKEDSSAMANSIIELMRNLDLTNKIIDQARKDIENFDWQKVKFQWIELLK